MVPVLDGSVLDGSRLGLSSQPDDQAVGAGSMQKVGSEKRISLKSCATDIDVAQRHVVRTFFGSVFSRIAFLTPFLIVAGNA
jgi:hypothetical protein